MRNEYIDLRQMSTDYQIVEQALSFLEKNPYNNQSVHYS